MSLDQGICVHNPVTPQWKPSDHVTMAILNDDVIKLGLASTPNTTDGARYEELHPSSCIIDMENNNGGKGDFRKQTQGQLLYQGSTPTEEAGFDSLGTVRAIEAGNHALLLECFKQGENPNAICQESGRTLMHVVVSSCCPHRELSWLPMVYQLSNAGSQVNVKNRSGVTPVQLAISRRLVQILSALLKCGADFSPEDEYLVSDIKGVVKKEFEDVIRRLTPSYWSAVLDPTPFKVSGLVRAWSRINIVNSRGQTLIEFAKQNVQVHEESIQQLLQHEASVELAHAVMAGDVDRSRVLLCNQAADLDTCDNSVKDNFYEPFAPLTLAGAAVKLGHKEVLALLRESHQRRDALRSPGGDPESKARVLNSVILSPDYAAQAHMSPRRFQKSPQVTSSLCSLL